MLQHFGRRSSPDNIRQNQGHDLALASSDVARNSCDALDGITLQFSIFERVAPSGTALRNSISDIDEAASPLHL